MSFIYIPDAPPADIDPVVSEWVQRELTRIADDFGTVAPRWDDLRFPAGNLKNGSSGVPAWNNTYGLQTFGVGDYVFATVQLPHAWKVGTELRPHIHWCKTTSAAGTVRWELEYRWGKIGEVIDAAWTTLSNETPTVSDGDTAWQHALTPWDAITPPFDIQISDMLLCKLERVVEVGSGYGPDVALLEFDIHYQIDSLGSDLEYIKL